MADRILSWRRPAVVLAAVAVSIVAGSAAGESRVAGPGLVAPAPNACLPGSGSRNWCGDGGPAARAKLAAPNDVAVAADGSLLIADTNSNVIRRVGPDGVIGTLAGDGSAPRRLVRPVESAARPFLNAPTGVAEASDGTVLVADSGNNAIRRITLDGRVEIVLGGRSRIGTKLTRPEDVLALPNGDILVADTGGSRVLRLTAAGAVEPVAGTGEFGFARDGVPATESPLRVPIQIATMPGGSLLIADRGTGTVRIVSPSGVIDTVEDVGDQLAGVAWTPDHGVVFSRSVIGGRERNTRSEIGRSDPSGGAAIRIAGTGRDAFGGDSGQATALSVRQPRQLAVAPDGALLIAEAGSDRIRRLGADGTLITLAGSDRPRQIASLPPPGPSGQGSQPGGPGCFGRHPRFEVFNFLPGDTETLSAGRRRVTVRVQTSVTARVRIVLKLHKQVLRRRVLEQVSNARVATVVKLRADLNRDERYIVAMNGRSLDDPDILRCDRRGVRVR